MTYPFLRSLLFPWAALGLLLLSGCGVSQYEKEAKIQANLSEALRQAQLNKTTEARLWADRAVALAPHAEDTYISTSPSNIARLSIADIFGASGTTLDGVGDDATLVQYMNAAAAKFPNDYRPLQIMTEAQERLGDTAGQKITATKLAALIEKKLISPGTGMDLQTLTLSLAQAYCEAGDQANGVLNYTRAIRVKPDDPEGYNGLAYAYAVANDKPHLLEALADAKKALDMAKRKGMSDEYIGAVADTLGWVQYRMGDNKDALVNVQQGVNANPRLAEGRYHLGMVYLALGQTDAARAELTHAVLLSKGYAAAQSELAKLPASTSTVVTAER